MASIISPSSQPTHLQGPPFDVGSIVIDLHMVVIHVHMGKNIIEDVLLDGGLGVNIITEYLRKKIKLPIPKPTLYTLRMVDQTLTKPVRLIRDLKIHIHFCMLFFITVTIIGSSMAMRCKGYS
jgi:hypothetical protein